MAKAGRGSDQFPLRLPEGLRAQIKTHAEAAGRSMNAEVVFRLEVFDQLTGDCERARRAKAKLEAELTAAKEMANRLAIENKQLDARRQALADELAARVKSGLDVMGERLGKAMDVQTRSLEDFRPLLQSILDRLASLEGRRGGS